MYTSACRHVPVTFERYQTSRTWPWGTSWIEQYVDPGSGTSTALAYLLPPKNERLPVSATSTPSTIRV